MQPSVLGSSDQTKLTHCHEKPCNSIYKKNMY